MMTGEKSPGNLRCEGRGGKGGFFMGEERPPKNKREPPRRPRPRPHAPPPRGKLVRKDGRKRTPPTDRPTDRRSWREGESAGKSPGTLNTCLSSILVAAGTERAAEGKSQLSSSTDAHVCHMWSPERGKVSTFEHVRWSETEMHI